MIIDTSDPRLAGVYVVLATPYLPGGTVDTATLRCLVSRCERAGIQALTALGNTSEVHRLSPVERREVLEAVAGGGGSALLVAGLEGSVAEMSETAVFAAAHGYEAVMIHEPADPLCGSSGLRRFFVEVADAVPVGCIPYLRSGRMRREDIRAVAAHPHVVAVKVAQGNYLDVAAALTGVDVVPVFGRAEGELSTAATAGYRSFTSGLANSHPHLSRQVWELLRMGELAAMDMALKPLIEFESIRSSGGGRFNVAAVKVACAEVGLGTEVVRAPNEQLDEATRAKVLTIVRSWAEEQGRLPA